MDLKDILAANLKKLMDATPSLGDKTVAAQKGGVGRSSLYRYMGKDKTAPRIDALPKLAEAFKVQPWQLLVPDLKVEAGGPRGMPKVSAGSAESASATKTHSDDAMAIAAMFDKMPDGPKKNQAYTWCVRMMRGDEWPLSTTDLLDRLGEITPPKQVANRK